MEKGVMAGMRTDKKSICLFLVLTFGIAWALQFTAIFSKNQVMYTALVAVCMYAPLIAVWIVHKGLREAKTGVHWKPVFKKNWKWFLLAWPGMAALIFICTAFYFLLFPQQFSPEASWFAAMIPEGTDQKGISVTQIVLLQILTGSIYGPMINTFAAIGEETGWRGYLVPALKVHVGRRKALILCGVIWGVWHWPLIFLKGYEYGTGYPGAPFTGAFGMILFTTVIGILLSFLYDKSRCIWVPALGHGTLNALAGAGLYFMQAGTTGYLLGPTIAGVIAIIPAALLACICWLRSGQAHDAE